MTDSTSRGANAAAIRREVDRRFHETLDRLNNAYILCNRQWQCTYVNRQACRMLGADREQVLDSALWEVVPDLRESTFLAPLTEAMERQVEICITGWLPSRELWLQCHCHPSPEGVAIHLQDVTEQKRAEERLQLWNETLESRVAARTGALAMLCDIATMANRAQDVEEALRYCLRRVAEHNGWCIGHAYLPSASDSELLLPSYVWYGPDTERFEAFRQLVLETPLRRGQGLPGLVYQSGLPTWSTDLPTDLEQRYLESIDNLATAAAFPITSEDQVVGVMEFFANHVIQLQDGALESMAAVGLQLGRVVERKILQNRLLELAEEEHRRIGQELHDDVGQELTGLALKAETLEEMLAAQPTHPQGELALQLITAIERIRGKIHTLSRGLVPMEIDAPALPAALEQLARQTDATEGLVCRFLYRGDTCPMDCQSATQLYRVAQEAVSNVLRHSRAKHLDIVLSNEPQVTVLQVRDDGRGLPSDGAGEKGLGLQIMRYRARLVGGTLTITPPPDGGTLVTCRVPVTSSSGSTSRRKAAD